MEAFVVSVHEQTFDDVLVHCVSTASLTVLDQQDLPNHSCDSPRQISEG